MKGTVTDVDGTVLNIVLTFSVTPVVGREDYFYAEALYLELNERLYDYSAAAEFVTDLYSAYDYKSDSLADYYRETGYYDGIAQYYIWYY
jgi:hypothetical protein